MLVHEGNDRVTEPMPSLESCAVRICVQAGHRFQLGQESAHRRGDDVQIHDIPERPNWSPGLGSEIVIEGKAQLSEEGTDFRATREGYVDDVDAASLHLFDG